MTKIAKGIVALGVMSQTALSVQKDIVLAVHGGTGIPKKEMTADLEKGFRAGLEKALREGLAALKKGGGLDAVEKAVRVLEDDPMFNAGKGAVFTIEGRNELDASIMEGKTKKGGAVAAVTVIKNPISAARAVMEKSEHVLLAGRGAEVFATQMGLEIVDPAYFWTERRWKQIQRKWDKDKAKRNTTAAKTRERTQTSATKSLRRSEWSTVGAVARDSQGNLFAATSTGGMTGKRFGRVGDSPILGAGTYADNAGVAVSGTGHGEYFIRFNVAADINALVKYKGMDVDAAANDVIFQKLKPNGGEGGVIVLDAKGNFASPYHADGLYRGTITADGNVTVALY